MRRRDTSALQRRLTTLLDHTILVVGAIAMSLPVLVIFMTSTHSNLTIATDGLQILPGDQFQTVYGRLTTGQPLFAEGGSVREMLFNSLAVAIGFAGLKCLTSVLAAYALVYFRFRFASFFFGIIVITMFFPVETRFLPTFLVTDRLGLLNTYSGVVLPLLATGIGTLLFRQYFRQIPEELQEAARIDGAGPIRFLIDILIPASRPMIGALFVIFFVIGWNQYLWPILVATSDEGMFTLVRGIRRAGQAGNLGMALAVVAILPPAVLIISLQRLLFRGLSEVSH